ncbi:hypothetical protein F4806DRAFT_490977 [Annulohypoxylon nitens]|nr:hypothetical protein F4806DRAFT_490977 [Annulohypoxylon nitens]
MTSLPSYWVETEDWHTAGEPFHIIEHLPAGHLPEAPTVAQRRLDVINSPGHPLDILRQSLCHEPRGHADMYGGFMMPPDDSNAHFGVMFWHKDGFSTACGHGTIALGYWAVTKGLVKAPQDDGTVDVVIDSLPAGVRSRGVKVNVDLAFGGAVYATLDAQQVGLKVEPGSVDDFIRIGREIKASLGKRAHYGNYDCYGVIFFDEEGVDPDGTIRQKNVTVFADGQIDRSPCGSGTSARLAVLFALGRLGPGRSKLVHRSIIGSQFEGEILSEVKSPIEESPACKPVVRGRANLQNDLSVDEVANLVNNDGNSHEDDILPDIATYPSELSHSEFSLRLQQRVESRPQGLIDHIGGASVPHSETQVQSNTSLVVDAVKHFPQRKIANFLLIAFLKYAYANCFYVDEQFLRTKLDDFYLSQLDIGNDDISWVCTALMVFAIGTQFAHLITRAGEDAREQDPVCHKTTSKAASNQLALVFYHQASKLIPDVIAAASIESVQAFLLLAVYMLPVDAAGLSCVYLSIAIRIATLNDMHRNLTAMIRPKKIELRKRLWWSVYTLERRVCILHGRPLSISQSEVDCETPSGSLKPRLSPSSDVLQNFLVMIKLTNMLELAKDRILDFKKAPKELRLSKIDLIYKQKTGLEAYWDESSKLPFFKDLDASKPIFRFNIHLILTFHLTRIFMGRSFIPDTEETQFTERETEIKFLVDDCTRSAIEVVNLCQILHDQVGFARASYTEFTSCSAALIVLLARRISIGTKSLQPHYDKGIKLLKKMSLGIYSNSNKLTVDVLEKVIHKLQARSRSNSETTARTSRYTYAEFNEWAALQQSQPMAGPFPDTSQRSFTAPPNQNPPKPVVSGETNLDPGPDDDPLDFDCFVSDTGLDKIFRFGL